MRDGCLQAAVVHRRPHTRSPRHSRLQASLSSLTKLLTIWRPPASSAHGGRPAAPVLHGAGWKPSFTPPDGVVPRTPPPGGWPPGMAPMYNVPSRDHPYETWLGPYWPPSASTPAPPRRTPTTTSHRDLARCTCKAFAVHGDASLIVCVYCKEIIRPA